MHVNMRTILGLGEHDGIHLLDPWNDIPKSSCQHTLQSAEGFDFLNGKLIDEFDMPERLHNQPPQYRAGLQTVVDLPEIIPIDHASRRDKHALIDLAR